MLKLGLATLAVAALPAMALASGYTPPAAGTKFIYGTYEGGDTPFISHTVTALAGNSKGFVGLEQRSDAPDQLIRYLYGFTSYYCEFGGHVFGDGLDMIWPLEPGKSDASGAFFVIGKDLDAWVNGQGYDVWAIREVTEHGTTWVTRFAPALGIDVDEIVGIEAGAKVTVDFAAVQECLNQ